MKLSLLLTAAPIVAAPIFAVVAFAASVASADTIDKTSTTICLDSGGRQLAPTCKSTDASRIEQHEDICICHGATLRVKVPLCPPGVKPPGESAAYEQARLKAVDHGSLMNATWQGQPMCVAPHWSAPHG
jgi:hypothetical protein